jgi:hypothetical protein
MIVNAPNDYTCDKDERIWIKFSPLPSFDNVEISKSFDGEPLKVVNQTFITFKMGESERDLILSFKFATGKNARCDIEIEGENGGEDNDLALDIGIPDRKDYVFRPA